MRLLLAMARHSPSAATVNIPERAFVLMRLPEDDDLDPAARIIDIGLRTVSVWFLPLILLTGLSLRAALGGTFPIRVGAPPDPLAFPTPVIQQQPMQQQSSLPLRQPLLLASTARDPVLEDLRDTSSAARTLSLPKAEQRREAALQELEDERLERCRSSSAFSFDQCFFFGSLDAVDSRRGMEGGGKLPQSSGATRAPSPLGPSAQRSGIPTW